MRLALLIALFAVVGCGGPEVSRVTGTVHVEGEPPKGTTQVCFWPRENLALGIMAAFHLDEQGSFDIVPDPSRGQGRAGLYKVIVAQPMKKGSGGVPMRKAGPGISKRYSRIETTPLEQSISPGMNEIGILDLAADQPNK